MKSLKHGATPGPFIETVSLDRSRISDPDHSPIIMSYPHSKIYSFTDDGIKPIAYRDTDHYQVTKSFLDSPERMLKHLFDGNSYGN